MVGDVVGVRTEDLGDAMGEASAQGHPVTLVPVAACTVGARRTIVGTVAVVSVVGAHGASGATLA